MRIRKFPGAWPLTPEFYRILSRFVDGRHTTGTFTLAASATTTTVNDPLVGPLTNITFSPLSADAAAAVATTYVSAQTQGSFTVTHASAATTDRAFSYFGANG